MEEVVEDVHYNLQKNDPEPIKLPSLTESFHSLTEKLRQYLQRQYDEESQAKTDKATPVGGKRKNPVTFLIQTFPDISIVRHRQTNRSLFQMSYYV